MKRARSGDEVVTVSFVDRKYQIPLSVLLGIPRFELLLRDNPDAEHIHLNELDLGVTATLLQLHDVPRVPLELMDPNEAKQDRLYDICAELVRSERAHEWKNCLRLNNTVMLHFDVCIIEECNSFDMSFVGSQMLFLIKKNVFNQCLGYHKRVIQTTRGEIGIVSPGAFSTYGSQLYVFDCEASFYDFRVFFCLRYQLVKES